MAQRSADAQYFDTHELTRSGRQVQGQTPLDHFQRLVAGLPDQAGAMAMWSLSGLQNPLGQSFLDLHVQAAPVVYCQRCMGVLPYPVDSTSRLQVVESEAELDQADDPDAAPDEWIEPVLASTHLDVLALVEDELILALPYVPMHDSCPMGGHQASGGGAEDDPDPDPPSPFEVLRQLKKN